MLEYHPYSVDPKFFTHDVYRDMCRDLLDWYPMDNPEFGFDVQYDRTLDQDGVPGEYVQVWMRGNDES